MSLPVSLGPIDFSPVPDANGITWMCTKLDGWDNADSDVSTGSFTSRDGGVVLPAFYTSRPLVLGGIVKTPTEEKFWQAYYGLSAVVGYPTIPTTLSVDEADTVKTLQVIRATGGVRKSIGPGHFEFEMNLVAPDPIKYGEAETVTIAPGANASLTNIGTYPSRGIVVTLNNDGDVDLVHENGWRLYSIDPMATDTELDFTRRTAILDGENRYHQLNSRSEWWSLLPGANVITNAGAGSVSIDYQPAWM